MLAVSDLDGSRIQRDWTNPGLSTFASVASHREQTNKSQD